MKASNEKRFERNYALHLQHLKLKGLQPKTIDAYSRAIRRIGERFDQQIDKRRPCSAIQAYFTEHLSRSTPSLFLRGLRPLEFQAPA